MCSGALCLIDNSRQTTYGYDVRLEVLGDKGLLSLKNPPVHSVSLYNESGLLNDVAPFSFPERYFFITKKIVVLISFTDHFLL